MWVQEVARIRRLAGTGEISDPARVVCLTRELRVGPLPRADFFILPPSPGSDVSHFTYTEIRRAGGIDFIYT